MVFTTKILMPYIYTRHYKYDLSSNVLILMTYHVVHEVESNDKVNKEK